MFVDEHVIASDGEPGDRLARINVDEIVSQVEQVVGKLQLDQNRYVKRQTGCVIRVCRRMMEKGVKNK